MKCDYGRASETPCDATGKGEFMVTGRGFTYYYCRRHVEKLAERLQREEDDSWKIDGMKVAEWLKKRRRATTR